MHPSSGINEPRPQPPSEARRQPGKVGPAARRTLGALLCAAFFAAGCGNNNINSGYGIAWVTLTDEPGDFTSYIVNVDSITLTRSDGGVYAAISSNPETVDFTKLNNIAEMWGSGSIPVGTYTSASIVLDYTNAVISVMVNGLPQKATVVDSTGAAVTTQTINVTLDPANPLTVVPTYATSSAQRLAVDFNLAASTSSINLTTSPPTVTVKPYLTMGVSAPDNKLIRVRGPLINSSVNVGTYTVYVRPFNDIYSSLGSLSLFVDPSTIYAINGTVSTGTPGITQLSQSSAGTTMTAAYATYEPTASAGIFHAKYVVAGSTLEDVYTSGLEGDVVARTGNTLTLRGSTLSVYGLTPSYNVADATVILGPGTTVIADDSTLTGLNYQSVAVGQHIIARGVYTLPNNVVTLNASGGSTAYTGSVRLISTSLWGSLVSSTTGSLVMNLQTISNWPASDFAFAGNGTSAAADPVAAGFSVNTGALAIPVTTVGEPVWIDGLFAPFGSAPPDFTASSVNSEASVQVAGAAAGSLTCGQGNLDCVPASLRVYWKGPGTSAPFSALTGTLMTIDFSNANFSSGVIRIGPESIVLTAASASPQIVPQTGSGAAGVPATFTPLFSYGNPTAATSPGINVFSAFGTFATDLTTALATTPALQLEARGTYSRTTNTFSASSVNVVL